MSTVVSEHGEQCVSLRAYIAGFALSIALTLAAYGVAQARHGSVGTAVALVCILAVVQFVVQVVFFLHIGHERRPRWRMAAVAIMLLFVGIVVFGSWWIMHNLEGRMMSPEHTQRYLQDQDGGI